MVIRVRDDFVQKYRVGDSRQIIFTTNHRQLHLKSGCEMHIQSNKKMRASGGLIILFLKTRVNIENIISIEGWYPGKIYTSSIGGDCRVRGGDTFEVLG